MSILRKLSFFRRRPRIVTGSASAEQAAELLVGANALTELTLREARTVVSYMQPARVQEGVTFIREGDTAHNDFMMLVLDGEVTVESIVVSRSQPITVTVVGTGHLIGEMGLLDGAPRAASCTATTQVRGATLTRTALRQMLDKDPRTASKLLMAISMRMAARLRDSTEKLKLYAQLAQAMQQEINSAKVR